MKYKATGARLGCRILGVILRHSLGNESQISVRANSWIVAKCIFRLMGSWARQVEASGLTKAIPGIEACASWVKQV